MAEAAVLTVMRANDILFLDGFTHNRMHRAEARFRAGRHRVYPFKIDTQMASLVVMV
jgi:hypothetical protein